MKSFYFLIGKDILEIETNDGQITGVFSSSSNYGMRKKLRKTLEDAAKYDFEEFIKLHKTLKKKTNHYNMTVKILEDNLKLLEDKINEIKILINQ